MIKSSLTLFFEIFWSYQFITRSHMKMIDVKNVFEEKINMSLRSLFYTKYFTLNVLR